MKTISSKEIDIDDNLAKNVARQMELLNEADKLGGQGLKSDAIAGSALDGLVSVPTASNFESSTLLTVPNASNYAN